MMMMMMKGLWPYDNAFFYRGEKIYKLKYKVSLLLDEIFQNVFMIRIRIISYVVAM